MQTNTVAQQIDIVLEQYPKLQVVRHEGDTCIEGEFLLDVEVMGVPLYETYTIRIIIPPDYPKVMPELVELSNKIPTTFEHKNADQYCCLGVPGNLAFEFYKDPTLLHYVQDMVTNYFSSVKWHEIYGNCPFSERSHGAKGLFEFYRQYWNVEDDALAMRLLLSALLPGTYRGHQKCLCGSNKIARKCHGPQYLKIFSLLSKEALEYDCATMFNDLKKRGVIDDGTKSNKATKRSI